MAARQSFTLQDGSPLTPQEEFVLKQAASGKIADLKEEFGAAEEGRRLRARFLEELLTGDLPGVKIHRRGVLIENAIIDEPLDMQGSEVMFSVSFDGCSFKESVRFRDACFNGHLSFNSSHFLKEADFHRLKLAGSIFWRKTVFSGPVNFALASISGQIVAEGAKFLSNENEANFNGVSVGQTVNFDGAEFHGSVDFGGGVFKDQLGALRAKFLSESERINFNSIQVNRGMFFAEAEFHGPVDFITANVTTVFQMTNAKFLSENHKANFNGIQVSLVVYFDGAEFHGPVDFVGADIKGYFTASGAKFLAPDHEANFYGLKVGQYALFQGCDFRGPVDFSLIRIGGNLYLTPKQKEIGENFRDPEKKVHMPISTTFRGALNLGGAEIGGQLWADKALFLSNEEVSFNGMKVGEDLFLRGAIFAGPVDFIFMKVNGGFYLNHLERSKTLFQGPADFSGVEIAGQFLAQQAIFKNENIVFTALKVGLGVFFDGAIFFGGLSLDDAQLLDLEISGMPLDHLTLDRTKIARKLTIENIEINKLSARNLEVKGPAELSKLTIKTVADLRDGSFQQLGIAETSWPALPDGKKKVYLDGLTYESITTKAEPDKAEKWQELLDWLWYSRFNTQNFSQLDAFFQRCGLRKWADKVFIAGKRRELGKMKWWHPANWLTRFFWGVLAGFGRKPGRIVIPALALVLLGWFVFPSSSLPPGHWMAPFQQSHPIWTGLALSLDQFLPGVDLGLAKFFQPSEISVQVWLLWHLQKLLGWILIPIALAAIYTRIK